MLKKDNIKIYNKTFYDNHKSDEHICEICNGKYRYYNKTHHYNTKKHVAIANIMEKYENKNNFNN